MSKALWNRQDGNLPISFAANPSLINRAFFFTAGKQQNDALTRDDERDSSQQARSMEGKILNRRVNMLLRTGKIHQAMNELEAKASDIDVTDMVMHIISWITKEPTIQNKGELADQIANRIKEIAPRRRFYNTIMNAHLKSRNDRLKGKNAERWLRQADNEGMEPNGTSYNIVIGAYGIENIDDAQRIFDEYLERFQHDLNTAPFNIMMKVAALESRTRTETIMQQLLDSKIEIHEIITFMPIIECQAGHEDGGERAHYWSMKYREMTNREPDDLMQLAVLNAWAKSRRPDCGIQADLIMKDVRVTGTKHSTGLHNVWMNCWNKNRPPSLDRVLEILNTMEQFGMTDALSYSAAMQAWAKSGLPQAPMEAEALLKKMMPRIAPNIQAYEALMDAHARSPRGSSTRIFDLLSHVEKLSYTKVMRPTARTYGAALLYLALNRSPDTTNQAEVLMQRMAQHGVTPTHHIHSLLLTVYASDLNDAEAGRKAVRALNRMKESGEIPNIHVYTAAITALANHRDIELAKEMWKEAQSSGHEVTVVLLNAFLNALRQEGTTESAMEAETMLRSYMKSHEPNETTISTVMSAWAQLGRVDRTLALFNEMKRDYPTLCNLHVYTTMINAYFMGDEPLEAAHKVELLLQEIHDAGLSFNNVTLTIAIKAFARNPAFREKAISLLRYLEVQYLQSQDQSMKPAPEAYACLGITRSV